MSEIRNEIAILLSHGRSPKAIADELRLAESTVSYHIERLRHPPGVRPGNVVNLDDVRKKIRTREQVAELLAQGLTRREAARRLGLSKGTVSYHARRLGLPIDERGARRYDWDAVQRYYDDGQSVRDCISTFGFSHDTWNAAKKRGAVVTRAQRMPNDQLFVAGKARNRGNLKHRLLVDGLKTNCCEMCGLSEWHGRPLSMALHHINGDRLDNRLENLELLCPNCHSQTDTYSGRNGHRRRRVP